MQIVDKVFVAGEWRRLVGPRRELLNPATETAFAVVVDADAGRVSDAVEAARRAFAGWAGTALAARAGLLRDIGLRLQREADTLAREITEEVGTPLEESRRLQVEAALHPFLDAPRIAAAWREREDIGSSAVRRVPLGVAACITPWNYPLYLVATKIVPALLSGCTVVLKPSELAPRSALALAEAARVTGLPPGVLNVVVGAGGTVGEALVTHPRVDVVSFTGSLPTGRQIARLAGDGTKKVTLELGGKSASLVLRDADLEAAVRGTLGKCFQNAGQTCAALTRLLVPREQWRSARELAADLAGEWLVGDPLRPETRVGPLISAHQHALVSGFVARAQAEGARVLCGGTARPPHLARGWYFTPTVLATDRATLEIAQEEVFGPVLTVLPYDDEAHAVELANGTPYGLAGAVWSADAAHAAVVAARLRAGSVSINGTRTHPDAPFGGFGASGHGRERGTAGLDEFSTTQAIHQ